MQIIITVDKTIEIHVRISNRVLQLFMLIETDWFYHKVLGMINIVHNNLYITHEP